MRCSMTKNKFFVKLTEWEHWPTPAFYLPLVPFFLIKILRAPKPLYFLDTNPGIHLSGIGTESKYKTLLKVPEKFRPKSLLIEKETAFNIVQNRLKEAGITYPLIAKPDKGFRGYLVKLIENEAGLKIYLDKFGEEVLIQEFIPYTDELGIFYYRMPGETSGHITSVTLKKFTTLTGNGIDTLEQLIKKDDRAFLYDEIFRKIQKENYKKVYPAGEKIILSLIGNHSKGTRFINGNHLIDDLLENRINLIAGQIDGWFYGRLDIKFKDYDDFLAGKNFKILEVNGIISEPTHIYDASHPEASFRKAIRSVKYHWKILDKIARKNHKLNPNPIKLSDFIKELTFLRKYSKKIKSLNREDF